MTKKPTKPMTPFDELTTPFELTLLKLILPYTSAAKEQTIWILIKFIELKYTIRFFKNPTPYSSDLTTHSALSSPAEILELLTPYLSPEQAQMADQFQNIMEMMEMMSAMQAFESDQSESNTFDSLNPTDLMMGMLSEEQKEMFQTYQNLFNDTLDFSAKDSQNNETSPS